MSRIVLLFPFISLAVFALPTFIYSHSQRCNYLDKQCDCSCPIGTECRKFKGNWSCTSCEGNSGACNITICTRIKDGINCTSCLYVHLSQFHASCRNYPCCVLSNNSSPRNYQELCRCPPLLNFAQSSKEINRYFRAKQTPFGPLRRRARPKQTDAGTIRRQFWKKWKPETIRRPSCPNQTKFEIIRQSLRRKQNHVYTVPRQSWTRRKQSDTIRQPFWAKRSQFRGYPSVCVETTPPPTTLTPVSTTTANRVKQTPSSTPNITSSQYTTVPSKTYSSRSTTSPTSKNISMSPNTVQQSTTPRNYAKTTSPSTTCIDRK